MKLITPHQDEMIFNRNYLTLLLAGIWSKYTLVEVMQLSDGVRGLPMIMSYFWLNIALVFGFDIDFTVPIMIAIYIMFGLAGRRGIIFKGLTYWAGVLSANKGALFISFVVLLFVNMALKWDITVVNHVYSLGLMYIVEGIDYRLRRLRSRIELHRFGKMMMPNERSFITAYRYYCRQMNVSSDIDTRKVEVDLSNIHEIEGYLDKTINIQIMGQRKTKHGMGQ